MTTKTVPNIAQRPPLALVYCRISHEDPNRNYSLESQADACVAYAAERGFTLAAEPFLEAKSGATLGTPQAARGAAAARKPAAASTLIVYTRDRLSRHVAHMWHLHDLFRQYGTQVIFVTKGERDETSGNLRL